MGAASDTAKLVELLAIDCPDYVNGQNIAVDGGFVMVKNITILGGGVSGLAAA